MQICPSKCLNRATVTQKLWKRSFSMKIFIVFIMVSNREEGLPEKYAHSNVYMAILRGGLSIGPGRQEIHEYEAATLLKIPFQIKMNVRNLHDKTLVLLAIWCSGGFNWRLEGFDRRSGCSDQSGRIDHDDYRPDIVCQRTGNGC